MSDSSNIKQVAAPEGFSGEGFFATKLSEVVGLAYLHRQTFQEPQNRAILQVMLLKRYKKLLNKNYLQIMVLILPV